jgi:hypothetical protein
MGKLAAIAMFVTCFATSSWAQDGASVVVVLHDSAGVPVDVLQSARAFAATVFERAGVMVEWSANAGAGTACRPDSQPRRDDRFCVQVLLRASNRHAAPGPGRVMGVALAADERRAVLSLFFDAVTDVAAQYGSRVADVLGLALAHEMGHVLLPPPSHAPSGIMQPSWEGDDLRHAIQGDKAFTQQQAAVMRDRLARRP